MLNRFHPVSTGWVLTVGLLLVAFSALVPLRVNDRVRLGADVLGGSRGGDTMNVLTQSSCDQENSYPSSVDEPDETPCSYCDKNTFTNVTDGSNGGYDTEGENSMCGPVWSGECMNNVCASAVKTAIDCSNPVVFVQSGGG